MVGDANRVNAMIGCILRDIFYGLQRVGGADREVSMDVQVIRRDLHHKSSSCS